MLIEAFQSLATELRSCLWMLYVFFVYVFFFFQAEDGIRDLVRSRGLGDVYKRQEVDCELIYPKLAYVQLVAFLTVGVAALIGFHFNWWEGRKSVSYTHLTLPTSDLV